MRVSGIGYRVSGFGSIAMAITIAIAIAMTIAIAIAIAMAIAMLRILGAGHVAKEFYLSLVNPLPYAS
ncbi:MAG TPA: hypothetical protein PLI09_07745 [Candidatus Hydrogenedentes bacterium]|nr:hypothetical protein [Candidatus Hydrogenedentota bacterium]